jgi:hypothetical protein
VSTHPPRSSGPPTGAYSFRTVGSILTAVVLVACGGPSPSRRATGRLPASYIPLTVGPGPGYKPPIKPESSRPSPALTTADELSCDATLGRRFGVHIELFANRHVVLIPAGIGVSRPILAGAFVTGGHCYRPLVTLAPTGVVEVGVLARPATLGVLFALWGQDLTPTRLAGFAGHQVHAFVNGRPVPGDPADIRLSRHDEIVLETSGTVVPHDAYQFADGL